MEFNPEQWKIFGGTVELERTHMKVDHVDMDVMVHDTTNRDDQNAEVPFYFTDLQFQPGHQKTGWIPNTQEMMDRIEYDVDEWRKYNQDYIFRGVTPTQYPGMDHRIFNLLGRGHEVITLPNDLPEELFWELDQIEAQGLDRPVEILSTGIDFTIIPKDDFELCRIATNVGSLLPEDQWVIPGDPDHPLNTRYTREFYFDGGVGSADSILEVNASVMTARKNGTIIKTNGVKSIHAGGITIPIYKNKYHLIPRGSVRFRIEFFGPGLVDTGIGFGGTAKFKQWTYGVERI